MKSEYKQITEIPMICNTCQYKDCGKYNLPCLICFDDSETHQLRHIELIRSVKGICLGKHIIRDYTKGVSSE